jgi:DNA-binding phage protein
MAGQFSEWDSADYLKTPQDRANYLNACLEEAGDDSVFMANALVVLATDPARLSPFQPDAWTRTPALVWSH